MAQKKQQEVSKSESKTLDIKKVRTLSDKIETDENFYRIVLNKKFLPSVIICISAIVAATVGFMELFVIVPMEHEISMFEPKLSALTYDIQKEQKTNEYLQEALDYSNNNIDTLRRKIEELVEKSNLSGPNPPNKSSNNDLVLSIKNQIKKGESIKKMDAKNDETYELFTIWRYDCISLIQKLNPKLVSNFETSFVEVTNLQPEAWVNTQIKINNGNAILRTIINKL